ncbi:hypothetical protein BON30_26525 [Cystobacter ferrugineus]|uniref:Uncharacterized protein n=1 Tax=Cystobacter ferrugineus TaxID=83449 RepID=A0A1L9B665_9BACT|nr:hypothetical protein BON30_26525 [Cystobacter ferrugineus]
MALGHAVELSEGMIQQRLAGAQVPVSPDEGKPDAVAHEHLCLPEFLARYPFPAEVTHQDLTQVTTDRRDSPLVDVVPIESLREVPGPEVAFISEEELARLVLGAEVRHMLGLHLAVDELEAPHIEASSPCPLAR